MIGLLDRPPIPAQVLFRPAFRHPARPPLMGQLVQVNPQVQIPKIEAPVTIQFGLGGLPLSIGLFAASGLTFLIRSQLPDGWPKTVALLVGAGLGVGGVANLVIPPKAAAPAAPAPLPGPAPLPSGATAAGDKSAGFAPASAPAFTRVQIEVVSPKPDQEIDHTGTFLGVGTPKIPILLRLYNPSAENVTFNLEFEWDEFPTVIGYNREPNHGSKAFQVTLAPNEERNQTFDLPVQTEGFSTSITVGLSMYKKRTPEENRILAATWTFSVT